MKLTPALLSRLFTLAAALGLAACSLPPEAAWHVVKTDGLIPLIAMEMGARPYPPNLAIYSRPMPSSTYMGSAYDRVKPAPAPPLMVVHTDDNGPKPFPPRPDAPVVTVTSDGQPAPRPPRPSLITKKRSDSSPQKTDEPEPEHAPAVIATVKPRAEPEPESKPEPASAPKQEEKKELASTPAPSKPFNSAAQPPVRAIEESLPYGIAIPGRPGLVHSPYAAKNQFVDVAGLKPGQEVKCPYSGKLFRVPVGAQASASKPAETEDKRQ